MNVDLAHKDCLHPVHNIGETIVRNICDGTNATVPWGSLDWLGAIALVFIALAVVAMFLSLAYVMIFD